MSIHVASPLHQRMIEDMTARQLGPASQRSHIYSCQRFAAFLKRSPDTATTEDTSAAFSFTLPRPERASAIVAKLGCRATIPC